MTTSKYVLTFNTIIQKVIAKRYGSRQTRELSFDEIVLGICTCITGGYGDNRYDPVTSGDVGVVLCTPGSAAAVGGDRGFVNGAGW